MSRAGTLMSNEIDFINKFIEVYINEGFEKNNQIEGLGGIKKQKNTMGEVKGVERGWPGLDEQGRGRGIAGQINSYLHHKIEEMDTHDFVFANNVPTHTTRQRLKQDFRYFIDFNKKDYNVETFR